MKMLLNLPDTALIESLHNGHEKAFDVLFHRYKKDVHNVIAYYVKDRLATEDLCQDAFIRMYTSLKRGKYHEQGTFRAWALRIARNLCMDHLRQAARFPNAGNMHAYDCLCITSGQSGESLLMAKQQDQQLNVFINRLPDDQKRVVCLRYFEALSFKEMATLMDTNVNTLQGRMRYGLAHLRRQVYNTRSFLCR